MINSKLVNSLHFIDLYRYSNVEIDKLPLGDDKYEFIKLGTPILFYSEAYDHIYVRKFYMTEMIKKRSYFAK